MKLMTGVTTDTLSALQKPKRSTWYAIVTHASGVLHMAVVAENLRSHVTRKFNQKAA
jgi:hypothetical protein